MVKFLFFSVKNAQNMLRESIAKGGGFISMVTL